ncbi:hypothetical protein AALP_AAs65178U000600 [Arabis alpina]|uniref:Uncharacterized protein n=1 Tax=Arabis alpina TaxID=50452 RepID=A0A087FZT5_ARAAL|nr:hypothetical protein AALP_AAs65178U000600 [Arabis alpina]
MSSDSSASVKLDRKRVRVDPDVTLARAPDHAFDASIPTGIPLAGRSDRRASDASSPEIELPTYRPEVGPSRGTESSVSRPMLRDSTEEGSSYANLETSSKGSDPSDRVETDEGNSGGDKGSLVNFQNAEPNSPGPGLGHGIRLDDTNDIASTMRISLVEALNPAGGWGVSLSSILRPTIDPGVYRRVQPVKRKTPEDSIITLLRKNKSHIRNFYLPLEHNSPDIPLDSNKKTSSSQKKKGSTRAKKKATPVQTRSKKSSKVKLNLDVVDLDVELELPRADPPAKREGLRLEKAPIAHGRGKGMMGGLLAQSRRAEEARLERERQKEEARRKLKDEERKKKAEADAKRKKRADEEKEKAKPTMEKKRLAQEALGSRDRVEMVARFNTTGHPVEVDHLYSGAMVRVGDGDGSSSSPYDFIFDFRGGGKHISQMLVGYNFLFDELYALDQKNRKLNVQNGELVAESSRSKEARSKAELEVAKFKDLLDRSQQVNRELIARRDELSSKVDVLTSAAKDKFRRSIEIMEERSRAQPEVDRLSSLASQVVEAIRRMEKAAKEGVSIDAAKKEKLEARLASYTAEADQIILPPIPTDSSYDEAAEPRRNVALDISSSDSSDEEAERTEVDGRMSIAGKTLALTLAEIEEAANIEADQVNQLAIKLFGEEAEDNADCAGTEEPTAAEEPSSIEEPAAIEEPLY